MLSPQISRVSGEGISTIIFKYTKTTTWFLAINVYTYNLERNETIPKSKSVLDMFEYYILCQDTLQLNCTINNKQWIVEMAILI